VNLRQQLPAHSPLPFKAITAAAMTPIVSRTSPEASVVEAIHARYRPRGILRTDSGTSALTIALRGIAGSRIVALPAYCCFDMATAAVGAEVSVVFYDIDPTTLGPDFDSLRQALRRGATVIVVAHLYGVPVDMRTTLDLAGQAGATVIEDAAQGAGASLSGKPLGTFGSMGVLSFGRGKGCTAGRGGALLANDEAGLDALARADTNLGSSGLGWRELAGVWAQWLFARPSLYRIPASIPPLGLGETVYRSPTRARPPSAVSSRVLSVTWSLTETEAVRRRENAARLLLQVDSTREFAPVTPQAQGLPGYLRLPIMPSESASAPARHRDARRLGIMPGYPETLTTLPGVAARCVHSTADLSGARQLSERLCTLPTHSRLAESDLRRLENWLQRNGG
jgi:perosamine synthetase